MPVNEYLHYNGKIYDADTLLISPNNRSFRYGDGFFETMKMINGKIILEDYHFERLFASLELLQFEKPDFFTAAYLQEQTRELAKKNNHSKLARIRLMIFRGNGGLYDPNDHFPNHIIQTWELDPSNNFLNENGLRIGIFRDARKVYDRYSQVKSNNYLSYAMAALWAKQKHLDDALLLNSNNRITDATIANVFIVKDGLIKTPSLEDGCVSGVMRRHLLSCMRKENMPAEETTIEVEDLLNASEVFLTNSICGIRWVKSCGKSNYLNKISSLLHRQFVSKLF